MAQPVYSQLLGANASVPQGVWTTLGTVPAGFVWVVRHVSIFNTSTTDVRGLNGITLADSEFQVIYARGQMDAITRRWYGETVHQAVGTGDLVQVMAGDVGWSIRVSGFQLTLP